MLILFVCGRSKMNRIPDRNLTSIWSNRTRPVTMLRHLIVMHLILGLIRLILNVIHLILSLIHLIRDLIHPILKVIHLILNPEVTNKKSNSN